MPTMNKYIEIWYLFFGSHLPLCFAHHLIICFTDAAWNTQTHFLGTFTGEIEHKNATDTIEEKNPVSNWIEKWFACRHVSSVSIP